ncbi:MAG TPA: serine/threonine-protein kinase [Polyangiaceae bacterium]|jgi:serine/threonine-protein kinase
MSSTVSALGKYLLLAELGRGGMAEVYLALARGLNGFNKLVVLKLLRAHLAEDQDFLRMFLAEARLAARLNHANIVQTYEIGVEGGRNCIVMEYLEGRSLAEVEAATRTAPMPLSLSVRILADTLAGLHHAHGLADVDGKPLGLVHRDVSPHNVFVTYDGQVKVLDFGIAKAADDGARTKTGVFKGKVRYTAPERFSGEESDRRSDIFSVGVMLWQTLSRRRMWSGLTELAIMHQLASRAPIARPSTHNPDVPPRLDEICMKALAPQAVDRFATAAEFADALEEYLAAESVGSTNRALGKFMGETFGEIRQRFQRTVDEQLRVAAATPFEPDDSASVARLRADAIPVLGSPFAYESFSSFPAPSSSQIKEFSAMQAGLVQQAGIPAPPTSRPPGVAATVSPSEPPPRKRRAAAVLIFLVAAVTAFAFVVRRPERSAGSAVQAPTPALTAPATAAAPAPAPPPSESAPAAVETASAAASDAPAPKRAAPPPASGSWRGSTAPRSKAAPTPSEPHASTAPPPARAAEPAKVDCSSPYYFDEQQGVKKIRPECL